MKVRTLVLLFIFLIFASGILAQGVSPVIVEGKGPKVHGSFTVANGGLTPISTTIETRSFSVSPDGNTSFMMLDPRIHVTLSSTSAKIGAQQNFTFDYQVTCDQLPCWLTFYAVTAIGHTSSGESVRTALPHTLYICDKHEKHCRDSVRHGAFGISY